MNDITFTQVADAALWDQYAFAGCLTAANTTTINGDVSIAGTIGTGTESNMSQYYSDNQHTVTFCGRDTKVKVTIHTDSGKVEYGDDADIDEASEIFWTTFGGDSPAALHKQLEEAHKEIASLQAWKTLWEQHIIEANQKPAIMEDSIDHYDRAMKVISKKL